MYGIILAGGSGSRLWPLSRELYPKQLLKLNSDKSLLEATFERLGTLINYENIVSITNTKHAPDVKTQLNKIYPKSVVLSEPTAKNTAPAISVAVKYILDKYSDDVILVVPSDHLIKDNKAFKKTVEEGEKLAKKGYIVTFGIKPECAHTGYGYIKTSKMLSGLKVDEFKEKPDEKTAKKYFESGNYFWNSGIFMFKASVFFTELKKHAPEIYTNLQDFNFGQQDNIEYNLFDKMPNISIDYALMEKTKNIALVPLKSDWSDLGCWEAIYDIDEKDKEKNVKVGNILAQDCKNSLFFSSNRQ
jgi:mannose-1-phosphate guanylyltransferase/mannose-6-phosphate isomerase